MELCCEEVVSRFVLSLNKEYGFTIDSSLVFPLIKLGRRRVYEKGEIIVGVGERKQIISLIVQGIARSFYLDYDGKEVTKYIFKEYSLCNTESFFSNEKSLQGIEALEKIETIEFPTYKVKEYILSIPSLKDIYIRILENSLIYKMKRENSFLLKSATERYLEFRQEYKELEGRVSQNVIASYLGITPVSLSRIRRTIKVEK